MIYRAGINTSVTIAQNSQVSGSFQIPYWALFCGAKFPSMDDGDVTIEISDDEGNSWAPLLDPVDGSDLIVCKSGSDAGWIDVSDYVRFVANKFYLRFKSSASQSSDKIIRIYFA